LREFTEADRVYRQGLRQYRDVSPLAPAWVCFHHALAEDYLLEEVVPGKTRFTYSVALEPRRMVTLGGPLSRMYFESMFKSACKNLQSYVKP